MNKFLFGSPSTLLASDLFLFAFSFATALLVITLFWKAWKLFLFDAEFAVSVGYSRFWLDMGITLLMVLVIVVGLQGVGILLMSSLLVAPAAAARQWSTSLGYMVALSSFFGALAGFGGALVSFFVPGIPTGPTVVLLATSFVFVSLLKRR